MSILEEAMRELDDAVRRLEGAIEARIRNTRAHEAHSGEQERTIEDLQSQLALLRREHAQIEARAGVVAQRLDAAIDRLKDSLQA